jgi:hypothetical protein
MALSWEALAGMYFYLASHLFSFCVIGEICGLISFVAHLGTTLGLVNQVPLNPAIHVDLDQ